MSEMGHAYIDDEQVAERYLTGRLPPEDRTRFEEHFLGCARCQAQIETLEDFRRSLADLATDAVAVQRPGRRGVSGRPAALFAPWLLALAAALIVAVSAAALYLLGEAGRARRELENVKQASAVSRGYEDELREALERERQTRIALDEKLRALPATALGAAVFTLNLTRGGGGEPPENRIVLPEPPAWLVLVVDRPESEACSKYRVRLSSADRHPVGDALTPSPVAGDQLAVALPPGVLAPGDFMLSVEGLSASGRVQLLATYTFRAVENR